MKNHDDIDRFMISALNGIVHLAGFLLILMAIILCFLEVI